MCMKIEQCHVPPFYAVRYILVSLQCGTLFVVRKCFILQVYNFHQYLYIYLAKHKHRHVLSLLLQV